MAVVNSTCKCHVEVSSLTCEWDVEVSYAGMVSTWNSTQISVASLILLVSGIVFFLMLIASIGMSEY